MKRYTSWKSNKGKLKSPLYIFGRANEQDIAAGRLPTGTKLPPHRKLSSVISSVVFESVALKADIKVYVSECFITGDSNSRYYLRISTSGLRTDKDLETALSAVKRIIDDIKNQASYINYTV